MSFFPDKPMTEQYCEISLILSFGKKNMKVLIRRWEIPLLLERNFGNISFRFKKGGLLRFKSWGKNRPVLEYDRGDYQIEVDNGEGGFSRDGKAWELLLLRGLDGLSDEEKKLFLKHLYDLWEKLEVPEEEIYQQIRELGFREELKAFLYYSWHRVHVEERAFPSCGSPYYKEDERPNPDFNGGRTFLGATYCVIRGEKKADDAEDFFKKKESKGKAREYFEELKRLVEELGN